MGLVRGDLHSPILFKSLPFFYLKSPGPGTGSYSDGAEPTPSYFQKGLFLITFEQRGILLAASEKQIVEEERT